MMVLPIASVSGKSFRDVLRLMTITRGESAASCSEKSRPATTGIDIVAK